MFVGNILLLVNVSMYYANIFTNLKVSFTDKDLTTIAVIIKDSMSTNKAFQSGYQNNGISVLQDL